MNFNIFEIYKTIQGESSYAGLLCVMVRFAGCNLNCTYCDTKEAQTNKNATVLNLDDLIKKIVSYDCELVELTGGEPLIQNNISFLIDKLIELGITVLVETNGSQPISTYSNKAIYIIDVKCPSSGAFNSFLSDNLMSIKSEDELKFVISDKNDYHWAKKFIVNYKLPDKCNIIFSPVLKLISPEQLADWMVNDNLNSIRLQVQLHKIIWGHDRQGV